MILFKHKTMMKWSFMGLIVASLFYSCDSLKEDALPDTGTKVSIEGSEIHLLTNTQAYIDLHSLVKTTEQIQFKIVSQPRNGSLSEMDKGVLQYSPFKSFTRGKDSFGFSVLTLDNKLLHQDSVVIIISTDSTSLPCGMYAITDSIRSYDGGEVTIDVLKNDILCDTTHIKLQVYKPVANAVPLYGSAVVVNKKIKYIPNTNFNGDDYIFYKVSSTLDSSQYTFGKVSITVKSIQPPAPSDSSFVLYNDNHTYPIDSIATADTLYMAVFVNDHLPGTGYTSSLVSLPKHGTASLNPLISINYVANASLIGKSDSITYKVCKATQCKTAKVYIKPN